MKVVTTIARILLGLAFVVFGANAFLLFLPMPPPPPGLAGDFFRVFVESHYMHVVAAMQVLGGLLLLIDRFVPLGLTILGAIIFNILTFHVLMSPAEIMLAAIVAVLELFLVWQYRDRFAGIFKP
jgi:uncharacterized membrane protein YphA (DoxX/SURF4 family)